MPRITIEPKHIESLEEKLARLNILNDIFSRMAANNIKAERNGK